MDILKKLVLPIVPQKYLVKLLLTRVKHLFEPELKLSDKDFSQNSLRLSNLNLNRDFLNSQLQASGIVVKKAVVGKCEIEFQIKQEQVQIVLDKVHIEVDLSISTHFHQTKSAPPFQPNFLLTDLLKAFLYNLTIRVTHLSIAASECLVEVPKIDFAQVTFGQPSLAQKSLVECLLVNKNLSLKEVKVTTMGGKRVILGLTTIQTSFHSFSNSQKVQIRTHIQACEVSVDACMELRRKLNTSQEVLGLSVVVVAHSISNAIQNELLNDDVLMRSLRLCVEQPSQPAFKNPTTAFEFEVKVAQIKAWLLQTYVLQVRQFGCDTSQITATALTLSTTGEAKVADLSQVKVGLLKSGIGFVDVECVDANVTQEVWSDLVKVLTFSETTYQPHITISKAKVELLNSLLLTSEQLTVTPEETTQIAQLRLLYNDQSTSVENITFANSKLQIASIKSHTSLDNLKQLAKLLQHPLLQTTSSSSHSVAEVQISNVALCNDLFNIRVHEVAAKLPQKQAQIESIKVTTTTTSNCVFRADQITFANYFCVTTHQPVYLDLNSAVDIYKQLNTGTELNLHACAVEASTVDVSILTSRIALQNLKFTPQQQQQQFYLDNLKLTQNTNLCLELNSVSFDGRSLKVDRVHYAKLGELSDIYKLIGELVISGQAKPETIAGQNDGLDEFRDEPSATTQGDFVVIDTFQETNSRAKAQILRQSVDWQYFRSSTQDSLHANFSTTKLAKEIQVEFDSVVWSSKETINGLKCTLRRFEDGSESYIVSIQSTTQVETQNNTRHRPLVWVKLDKTCEGVWGVQVELKQMEVTVGKLTMPQAKSDRNNFLQEVQQKIQRVKISPINVTLTITSLGLTKCDLSCPEFYSCRVMTPTELTGRLQDFYFKNLGQSMAWQLLKGNTVMLRQVLSAVATIIAPLTQALQGGFQGGGRGAVVGFAEGVKNMGQGIMNIKII